MQTILGANGTIGSLLAKELTTYTHKIRLVSRNPRKVNVTDELFATDLSVPENVEKAIQGSEIVYLMVGFDYNLKIWQEKWPSLMQATIDACIKYNAKLVFFDNVYMYDKTSLSDMTEDAFINPPSKKGLVRKQIADILLTEVQKGRLTGLIARSADFYGPRNDKSYLMLVVHDNFKKGKKANWFSTVDKIHSFTYTPDAAKATALLGNTSDAYNQVWHLPTDSQKLTGRDFIHLIASEMKMPAKFSVLPKWLVKLLGLFIPFLREMPEMMYQYEEDYFFNSSKFEKRFSVKPTTYKEGIENSIEL